MIIFVFCWILHVNIILRLCMSTFMRDVSLHVSFSLFLWYSVCLLLVQVNISYIKLNGNFFLLFYFPEGIL